MHSLSIETAKQKELDSLNSAAKKRIQKNVSKDILLFLDSVSNGNKTPLKEDLITVDLPPINADLVKNAELLIVQSLLLGMEHASNKLQLADSDIVDALPFEEAVSFLKAKVPLAKAEWTNIEEKVRFRAFTVARLTQVDYIEAVRSRLSKAQESGEGFAASWADIKGIAESDDALDFKAFYWENVYRTNVQTAYTAGRLMQYTKVPPPAWELMIMDDARTSSVCRALIREGKNNLAMPASHSFWKKYGYPPYHFQCRTVLRAVYSEQIGSETVVENPSMKSLRETFRPAKGFGGNPVEKESWWKMTPSMVKRAEHYGVMADILQQAHDMDMISYQSELLKGYERFYTGSKGGYVDMAKNYERSEKEIAAAKRLADDGHTVYMLARTQKAKSPDLLIDNQIGEIKHPDGTSLNSIKNNTKEAGALQRARTLVLYPAEGTAKETVVNGLYSEIMRTPITQVILNMNGTVRYLSRKAVLSKDW